MIQANEIRFGSWILAYDGMPVQITTGYMIDLIESGGEYYNGIPLSPSVLEDCGFVKDEDTDFYKLTFAYPDTSYPSYLSCTGFDVYVQVCRNFTAAADAPCKYLHQLQNLFWCLTGTELIYKPKK